MSSLSLPAGNGIAETLPQSDRFRLPQILDLTQAGNLREEMKVLLSTGAVELDAAEVLTMSTPCAQILLATGRAAESSNTTLRITNASAAFCAAVTDLGLQSHFNPWMG